MLERVLAHAGLLRPRLSRFLEASTWRFDFSWRESRSARELTAEPRDRKHVGRSVFEAAQFEEVCLEQSSRDAPSDMRKPASS